jgi:hypothetical protein
LEGLGNTLEILSTFDTGSENHMESSPAIAWEILSQGYKTGLLYIDSFGMFMGAAFLFGPPLGIWCCAVFAVALGHYRRKKPAAKKAFVWASILFGLTLGTILCICLASLSIPGCVPVAINPYHETDPRCRLPIRPGVVAPSPTYYNSP